ncbi:unnamed protein product [Gadus morhua 'NCC']
MFTSHRILSGVCGPRGGRWRGGPCLEGLVWETDVIIQHRAVRLSRGWSEGERNGRPLRLINVLLKAARPPGAGRTLHVTCTQDGRLEPGYRGNQVSPAALGPMSNRCETGRRHEESLCHSHQHLRRVLSSEGPVAAEPSGGH